MYKLILDCWNFKNMNNGLHLKELVLCVEPAGCTFGANNNKNDHGAFGCVVWGRMLLGNRWGVCGVCMGQETCVALGKVL